VTQHVLDVVGQELLLSDTSSLQRSGQRGASLAGIDPEIHLLIVGIHLSSHVRLKERVVVVRGRHDIVAKHVSVRAHNVDGLIKGDRLTGKRVRDINLGDLDVNILADLIKGIEASEGHEGGEGMKDGDVSLAGSGTRRRRETVADTSHNIIALMSARHVGLNVSMGTKRTNGSSAHTLESDSASQGTSEHPRYNTTQ